MPLCSPASHLLQAIRARAADGWPIERPSMNCRVEKISERRSYGEIGQRRSADSQGKKRRSRSPNSKGKTPKKIAGREQAPNHRKFPVRTREYLTAAEVERLQ